MMLPFTVRRIIGLSVLAIILIVISIVLNILRPRNDFDRQNNFDLTATAIAGQNAAIEVYIQQTQTAVAQP
jgi:hypothetical protein